MTGKHGFAMADALIALLITALFLSALLSVNSSSLRAAGSGETRLTAAMIARAVVEDASLRGNAGEVNVAGRAYTWRRNLTEMPSVPGDGALLTGISVAVSWQGPSGELGYRLETARVKGIAHEG